MNHALRANLPPIPADMRRLPIDQKRGFPVPYFVHWEAGVPDFRISDPRKMAACTVLGLCMICGQALHKNEAVFAFGALNCLNRVNDEPPMHRACAEFSAQACPWMLVPSKMKRREEGKPAGAATPEQLMDTPGAEYHANPPKVWALYDAETRQAKRQTNGTWLYYLGEPREIYWWKEGRRATYDEVAEACGEAYERQMAATPDDKHVLNAMYELGQWLPGKEA